MRLLQDNGWRGLILPGVLLALCLLPHYPALNADYTFDDFAFVADNASLRSLDDPLSFFASSFPPEDLARGLYRPITALSYALDMALLGDDPGGLHLSNLIYYWGGCLLFFLVARRYLSSAPAALAAALLFALHPVHCEAVDSITGRSELLALLFALLALLLFLRALERRGVARAALVAGAVGAFAAAALSKETGLMLPVLLVGHMFLFRRREERRPWALTLPFWLLIPAYLLLRAEALGGLLPSPHALAAEPLLNRLMTMGVVFLEYARLLLLPLELQIDFYYQQEVGIQQGLSTQGLGGVLLALLLMGLLGLLARRALQEQRAAAAGAVGLLLFFVFLAPVSNAVPTGALMAERFLYTPSAGFILLLVAAGAQVLTSRSRRWAAALVLLVSLALFAGRSHQRSAEWRNTVTLWLPLARLLPDDHRVMTNLAGGYLMYGKLEPAARLAKRSLSMAPNDIKALTTLGLARLHGGTLDEAVRAFARAARVAPHNPVAHYGLGEVARIRGHTARARLHLARALAANPNHLPSLRAMADLDGTPGVASPP